MVPSTSVGRGARNERTPADAVPERLLGPDAVASAFEAHVHAEDVVRVRKILAYSIAGWVSSAALDFITVYMLGQGRLSVPLGIRAVAALAFLAVLLRLHVEPAPRPPLFRALNLLVLVGTCASLALIAVEQGTIATVYTHGVSVTLVAYGLAFQEPWRRGIWLAGLPVATFFAILLGAALFSPRIHADLATTASLGAFLQNTIMIAMTGVFVVTGGHVVHQMRRQAFSQRGLGRYELRERIARGGMGEIWRAHHAGLDREVAVKIVRPDRASQPGASARFTREVRALVELKHPCTVRILDHGVTNDGLRYFAMELLEGETIDARLSGEQKLEPRRAAEIARDVARALDEAHLRGIIHRDVTPKNLFLVKLATGEEIVKVLDFGIAKDRGDAEASTLTAHGQIIGTPTYMAPEQARGTEVDARTDVYALGAVLFRMLCGRPPFEKGSQAETLQAHVWDAPPKPSWIADVPPELETIVLRCLRKAPAERFATAGALADALEAFLRAPLAARPAAREPDAPIDAAQQTLDAPLSRP